MNYRLDKVQNRQKKKNIENLFFFMIHDIVLFVCMQVDQEVAKELNAQRLSRSLDFFIYLLVIY